MRIPIKSHLKTELITLMIAFLCACFIASVSIFNDKIILLMVIVNAVLGIMNAIYLFFHLRNTNGFRTRSSMVIYILCFPFLWYLFMVLSLPLMVVETIFLIKGKAFIGKGNRNEKNCDDEDMGFTLTEDELLFYNEFISKYQRKKWHVSLIVMIVLVLYILLAYMLKNEWISGVLAMILLWGGITRLRLWNINATDALLRCITDIVNEQCDSRSYYHICKALQRKYPSNIILVKHLFDALRLDHNDYYELKKELQHHQKYHTYNFYQIAYMDMLSCSEQKAYMEQHYDNIKRYYEKVYHKTKEIRMADHIIYWEMRKCILEERYEDALCRCFSIHGNDSNRNRLKAAYLKGYCLMKTGNIEEAKRCFDMVETQGNTLRIRYLAAEHLKQITS